MALDPDRSRPAIMVGSPPPASARVPFVDWDRAPWNRWSFQHMREIVPTVEVWCGVGPASALPSKEQDLDAISFTAPGGREMSVRGFLDGSHTDGFIVLHHGRIVMERYENGMTPRTLHLSQSVAKSVTAAVAGVLAGQGAIDPAALVTHYVPEFEATAYRGATLQNVLDMTSGVRFSEDYEDPYSDVGRIDVASGWKPPPGPGDWAESVFDVVLSLTELEAPHGKRFLYRSIETDVLAFCIERATGARLPTLVSDLVWQPMGAGESACFTVDRAGYALADGGLNATLRDYARFGSIYLKDGSFDGRRIVPESWVAETRVGNPRLFGAPYTDVTPRGAYHNQFWIEDFEQPTLLCRGVFGQMIVIAPQHDMVVVKLSSSPRFLDPVGTATAIAAIKAIGRALG